MTNAFQLASRRSVSQNGVPGPNRRKANETWNEKMASFDHFRQELLAQLESATKRGQKEVVINAAELHVAIGVFPNPKSNAAADVMESERKSGDIVIVDKANATGLTIRYLLPRSH